MKTIKSLTITTHVAFTNTEPADAPARQRLRRPAAPAAKGRSSEPVEIVA